MRRVAVILVGVAAVALGPAVASADVTVNPPAGPPGTEVTVSGIERCNGIEAAPALTFRTTDKPPVLIGNDPAPITGSQGTVTVPNVPPGEYLIYRSCGSGEGVVSFTVTPRFAG